MSIQIIEQPMTALGGFGRSLAQGLEKTMPKAVERGMLSQGLKNLERDAPNMTQMEIVSDLLSRPGGQEALPILEPMLRGLRSQKIQGAINDTKGQSQQGYSERALDPNFGIAMSSEELNEQAKQISRQTGTPYNEVFDSLEKIDAKRATRDQTLQSRNELGEKFFNEDLETFTQKSGNEVFKDIIGEMNLDYRNKVFADIERGVSPKKAAETQARDLLEFAKVRNGVKSRNNINFVTDVKKAESELSASRMKYEKAGALNLLADDLVTYKGMSKPYANAIAYPVSKEIKSDINKLNKFEVKVKRKVSNSFVDKTFDEISKSIKPSDSLQSIALQLEKKGLNPKSFLVYIGEKNKNNQISLTDRQNRELAEDISFRPSFADLLYSPSSIRHYL